MPPNVNNNEHVAEKTCTVEPRFNEGPKNLQYVFAILRFRYIEVLFHTSYYHWNKKP